MGITPRFRVVTVPSSRAKPKITPGQSPPNPHCPGPLAAQRAKFGAGYAWGRMAFAMAALQRPSAAVLDHPWPGPGPGAWRAHGRGRA